MRKTIFVLAGLVLASFTVAWSWPWRAAPVDRTATAVCKETPELLKTITTNAYCCGIGEKSERIECFKKNFDMIYKFGNFLNENIYSSVLHSTKIAGFDCSYPSEEDDFSKWSKTMDCQIAVFTNINNAIAGQVEELFDLARR